MPYHSCNVNADGPMEASILWLRNEENSLVSKIALVALSFLIVGGMGLAVGYPISVLLTASLALLGWGIAAKKALDFKMKVWTDETKKNHKKTCFKYIQDAFGGKEAYKKLPEFVIGESHPIVRKGSRKNPNGAPSITLKLFHKDGIDLPSVELTLWQRYINAEENFSYWRIVFDINRTYYQDGEAFEKIRKDFSDLVNHSDNLREKHLEMIRQIVVTKDHPLLKLAE